MKKSAAAHDVDELVAFAGPSGREDRANVRGVSIFFGRHSFHALRVHCRERREIVFADDHAGGCDHRRFLQRIRIMPHIARQKRRADRTSVNAVAIRLGARRLARVEFGRGLGRLEHTDRRRQNVIERPDPVFRGNGRRGLKTRHLGQRVHARVGAAGALGQYIFRAQSSNG